ncbi:GNAT family N-acetyltransferase [Flavobacterium fluviale]|uniref:N-acetyltransferase domain-containing protein n=1 Tax=Flavobacterium fluviale TaxID=2249356 RepID=A0A344LN97_9FLAO|nr:GNAT family N-acetyltransferase [Flavobacterium fluviale]AXB55389.1 hypothetical protein HYN86_01725 [Flavobacterium fluviale]
MKAQDIVSDRLLLKRLSINHLSHQYVSWLNDHDVNKYLETKGNYTLEKLESFLIDQEEKDIYFWAIHLKENYEHIGNIKIDPINIENNSGEYGILMGNKKYWGKGYAKEASEIVINYCFEILGLKQITLGVIENNLSAVSLYKRLGFNISESFSNYGIYDNKESNLLRMNLENSNE